MSDPSRALYSEAGVDVAAGDALVERIKPAARSTARPGASPDLGGFGGVFDLAGAGHDGSLLVASTDGVGTKLRLATALGRHRGVGIDLVAMCVNDVLAQGAEPLFFLDYYASSRLDVAAAADVVDGIAEGCRLAGCALLGGETAEMPEHYAPGDYDLAGFVVGAVRRDRLLPQGVSAGDVLVGLPSSGAHANGYSLIRRLISEGGWDLAAPLGDVTLGEALLAPTRIYVRPVLGVLARVAGVHGIAHITGGGLVGNVPRMLPDDLAARIEAAALPSHPVMEHLKNAGGVAADEMRAVFNCGVGLVLAVAPDAGDAILADLTLAGERPRLIGDIVRREADQPRCRIS
ncbi:phosphoribosylformylglycinamidine cyclo-ligase [Acuticoccus sp.]|uniref:phosphoribosylformylglycinamidine cyclo-ligase n=1 Tax=Acuticoccus sp. TaxID=1904378 RepID=UPI003B5182FC